MLTLTFWMMTKRKKTTRKKTSKREEEILTGRMGSQALMGRLAQGGQGLQGLALAQVRSFTEWLSERALQQQQHLQKMLQQQ
jgi:hypothetical protein